MQLDSVYSYSGVRRVIEGFDHPALNNFHSLGIYTLNYIYDLKEHSSSKDIKMHSAQVNLENRYSESEGYDTLYHLDSGLNKLEGDPFEYIFVKRVFVTFTYLSSTSNKINYGSFGIYA